MATFEPKRRGLWFKLLVGFGALVLVLAGWLFLERLRGQAALRKYEKELIAKGEKLTFAEFVSPVPEGKNGAIELAGLTFQTGSALVMNSPPTLRSIAPGKALPITKEVEWFDSDGKRYTWAQVQSDLDRNKDVFDELRAIVRSPVLRYPVRYQGVFTPLPHLALQKTAAQWLSGSALFRIHTGDIDGAIDDIESIILLTRLDEHEPVVISQLVRIALVQIAVPHCWPLLQSHAAGDEQLARLQAVFASVDLIGPTILALEAGRASDRDTMNDLRRGKLSMSDLDVGGNWSDDDEEPQVLDKVPEEMKEAIRAAVVYPVWKYAFSHGDEKRLLEESQRLIDAARSSKEKRSATHALAAAEAQEKKVRRDGELNSWRYLGTKLLVASVGKVSVRALRAQTHCRIAVAVIALERYRLRHKKFPASLNELVPEFVSEVPIDYMDGKPLRYRLDGDQFVLWSVGPNGKDDNGTPKSQPNFSWMLGPDDVWPQPASDAQVAAYRESLRKR